ncbi:MAG: twin-arginine translocase TatA/TatE family subunit [Rubrobacter sp.]|nr:twin-arginine translocase TatA/TatE family subunit [Rubrobacter sp.]
MTLAVIPGLGSVGPMELIILLSIILLLFGAKRIPELAKGLGTGIREFRKGTSGQDEKNELNENEKEKEGALAGSAAEDKDNARMNEEAAREERDSDRVEERERAEQGAKRAEQNL